ncbi:MAG: hypothetical protein ACKVRN_10000 [Pyrinomonadaceae bacterium]
MGFFTKRAWEPELDRVVDMSRVLSRDWINYPKAEFLELMPSTWQGAVAEGRLGYVVVTNPEFYNYFEFHFMFGQEEEAPMFSLITRGLQELEDLWIIGDGTGELKCTVKPVNGIISKDAQQAVKMLGKSLNVPFFEAV